jgi:hypothetical protein
MREIAERADEGRAERACQTLNHNPGFYRMEQAGCPQPPPVGPLGSGFPFLKEPVRGGSAAPSAGRQTWAGRLADQPRSPLRAGFLFWLLGTPS